MAKRFSEKMYNSIKFPVYTFCILWIILGGAESKAISSNFVTETPDGLRDLYKESDNVIILNNTNFNSTILNSHTAHLVEFYLSSCGHCQAFAPKWKAFAKNVSEWDDVVRVGVVNCEREINYEICLQHNIKLVPTVLYFSPEDSSSLGIKVNKDETSLKKELLGKLVNEQKTGKGLSWPTLLPFSDSKLEDAWTRAPEPVKSSFFFFENEESSVGLEIILEMHKFGKILIHRVLSSNEELCRNNSVTDFPSLIVLDRQNNREYLNISQSLSPKEIVQVIKEFMHLELIEGTNTTDAPTEQTTTRDGIKEEDSMPDILNMADLKSAILYTLLKEIPRTSIIENESMEALRNYLQVLRKYLPREAEHSEYLSAIYERIKNSSSITGKEFRKLVNGTMTGIDLKKPIKWFQCNGSSPEFRGPPCGIWTLFHTLTVRHAENYETEDPDTRQPSEVVGAMYRYIENFFGCSECVQHFIGMVKQRKLFAVSSADDAVIWLWESHNVVNDRLAGSTSGDPKFPKVQYPVPKNCQQCRNNDGSWNKNEVLAYLKQKYGHSTTTSSS